MGLIIPHSGISRPKMGQSTTIATYPDISGFMVTCPKTRTKGEIDMTTIISGEENVRAAQSVAQLHYWRMQANMKLKFQMRPRWTLAMFTEMYGVKPRNWQDVFNMADAAIKDHRTQTNQAIADLGKDDI